MFASRVVQAVDVFEVGDFDLAAGLKVAVPDGNLSLFSGVHR